MTLSDIADWSSGRRKFRMVLGSRSPGIKLHRPRFVSDELFYILESISGDSMESSSWNPAVGETDLAEMQCACTCSVSSTHVTFFHMINYAGLVHRWLSSTMFCSCWNLTYSKLGNVDASLGRSVF
jgi:hypothetical protein